MIISESKAQYEMPDEGDHQAVCAFFVDLGEQEKTFEGKTKSRRECAIVFELDQKKTAGDYAGEPFVMTELFGANLNSKGKLRPFLEKWRKKPFTAEELAAFDTEQLVGANAIINVVHEPKPDGGVRAKIASIRPIPANGRKMISSLSGVPEWLQRMQTMPVVAGDAPPPDSEFGF